MLVHVLVFLACLMIALASSTTLFMSGLKSSAKIIEITTGQDRASQITLQLNQEIQLQGGINLMISTAQQDDDTINSTEEYQEVLLPLLNKIAAGLTYDDGGTKKQAIEVKRIIFYKMTQTGQKREYNAVTGEMKMTDIDLAIAECQETRSSGNLGLTFTVVLPR